MVIIAIASVKKLQSNTNTILSSLATADMLVSVLIMPLGMLQMVTGTRHNLLLIATTLCVTTMCDMPQNRDV